MPPRERSMPQPCPAVSPDHANEIDRRRAKPADSRLADCLRRRQILESHPVENVLAWRQVFDQRLGG